MEAADAAFDSVVYAKVGCCFERLVTYLAGSILITLAGLLRGSCDNLCLHRRFFESFSRNQHVYVVVAQQSFNAERYEATRVQSCLNSLATGTWSTIKSLSSEESDSNFVWSPSRDAHTGDCGKSSLTSTTAHQCLDRKWMMLIGDSSTRIMFSSLVQLLNGSSQDTDAHFPSHRPCDMCGSDGPDSDCCNRFSKGQDNDQDPTSDEDPWILGYYRDWWSRGTRITFVFKSLAERPVAAILRVMISESQQPDVLILQFGAWDLYLRNSVEKATAKANEYIRSLRQLYRGPMVWLTLPECEDSGLRAEVAEFNKIMVSELANQNMNVLSRRSSTTGLPDGLVRHCESFHAKHIIADAHAQWLLRAVC